MNGSNNTISAKELFDKVYKSHENGDENGLIQTSRLLLINYPDSKEIKSAAKKFWFEKIRLPKLWIGYLLNILLIVFSAYAGPIIETLSKTANFPPVEKVPIALPLFIIFSALSIVTPVYWFFCVYRIHAALGKMTNDSYPITPWRGVLYHLIPFYNLYWIMKWPREIIGYVNRTWLDLPKTFAGNTAKPKLRNRYRVGITILIPMLLLGILSPFGMGLPEQIVLGNLLFLIVMFGALRYLYLSIIEAFLISKK